MKAAITLKKPTGKLSVQETKKIVSEWDMNSVRKYLVRNEGLSFEETGPLETEYKRYLILRSLYQDVLSFPMSKPVDGMWHAHILHTRDYEKFERAVGCRLHHNPCVSDEELLELEAPYIENTMRMYKEVFGEEPDERYWPTEGQMCICGYCD